jgi:PAS domain S-box-containing protein
MTSSLKTGRPDPRWLLAAIVASSDDAIISKTLDGIITSWNGGATRIFGYGPEEVVGKPVTILIPAGQENEEPAILARLRRGERVDHYETRRRHKDGHLIDVSLTISPIYDDDGTIVGASKIARDITLRIQARAAVEEAAALRGAVAEAEAFADMVTHDLRTPLRAIEGFAHRMQRHQELSATAREELGFILHASDRMARTIDGLLQLTRITRSPVRRQEVDVSAMARATLADLRVGSERGLQVVVPDGILAEADPDLLLVVLGNLLANAWKFTRRQAHPRIEVGVSGGRPASYFVRDNGIGFAPEDAGGLFTPFHRLEPGGEFEGTGIGLATVRRAVERHGGKAWAEARPGEGATFWFTLGPT